MSESSPPVRMTLTLPLCCPPHRAQDLEERRGSFLCLYIAQIKQGVPPKVALADADKKWEAWAQVGCMQGHTAPVKVLAGTRA